MLTAVLLAGIDSINSKVSQDPEPSRVSDNDDDDDWCYHCNRCNSDEATEKEKDEARRLIDRVSNKRVMTAMNVSNTLKSKINASRAATVLYQKCCVPASNPDLASSSLENADDVFQLPEASNPDPCFPFEASTNQRQEFEVG